MYRDAPERDSPRSTALLLSVIGRRGWTGYAVALFVVGVCGAISWAVKHYFDVENGFLVFLLGVAVIAVRYGTGPSVFASFAATALLAFFFMPPIFDFRVSDVQHMFTLAVMVTIAIVISALGSQVLHQAEAARRSSERFESLYRLSRDLADLAGGEQLARAAVKHIEGVFAGEATVLLPDDGRGFLKNVRSVLGGETVVSTSDYGYGFRPVPAAPLAASFRSTDWSAARAARESHQACGLGTYISPNATALFLPLMSGGRELGVLAVRPPFGRASFDDDQRQMLVTLAGQLIGALDRDRLSNRLQSAQDEAETERMRSALLSSVSHDLRTPLAAIAGASSSMLDDEAPLGPEAKRELCQSIFDNADRLSRIVTNLLNMTRIESGTFKVSKQPNIVEEIVGSALLRMSDVLHGRPVKTRLPADLPPVALDDVLFQQVLVNLVDNAVRYVPGHAEIEISAEADQRWLTLEVADRGPGLPPGDEERMFEKFYRGPELPSSQSGTGLGLTICRAIIAAHGGTITAENRPGGGAVFRIRVPLGATTLAQPPAGRAAEDLAAGIAS
jgi:two-component system sensor histidine kinase KdpD